MLGRPAARKTRDREIERSPEQMHGTALADEAGAEFLEDPVALHEGAPEAVDRRRVVRAMHLVAIEGDRIDNLVRTGVDVNVHAEPAAMRP